MPAANSIELLSKEVRSIVNDRLRAAQYTGLIELAKWLTSQGYPVSRSAMQRYSSQLRKADQANSRLYADEAIARHEDTLKLVLAEVRFLRAEVLQLLRDKSSS